jgi:ATP/maltotriose-dependent transcriptional regulator MalT
VAHLSESDDEDTFAALDDLTTQGVLIGSGDSYRFRHDGLREALLRNLGDERRRQLHLRVAETLEDETERAEREAEVGWHFYQAGDHDRAARYLDRAGRRLFDAQALSDCIWPLRTAVEIYREQAVPRARYMELLAMLLAAGWVSDREVGDAVASEAVHVYHRYVGMRLAERLGRVLGRHLAFAIGLGVSCVKWAFALPGRRGPRPDRALIQFMVSLGYACGLANAANHVDQLKRYVRLADALDILPSRFPHAAYLGIRSFPDILLGHLGAGARKLSRAVEIIVGDRLTPATDFERRLAEAGMRGLRALIDVNQLNPRLHEDLARCAELGLRYYQLVSETTMVVHHRYRGEESRAREIERRLEAASLQLGSWSTDVQILLFAHPAYAICRDVVGLKRSYRELEQRVSEGMAFENRLQLIECELARERGDTERAVELGTRVVDSSTEDNVLFRQWGLCAVAEAHLAGGRWEEAMKAAWRCLEIAEDPDLEVVIPRLRSERILGMAEVASGKEADGTARLERLIRETESFGAPSLAGMAHDARARVALNGGDRPTYLHHANEANRWFRATENPCLIAIGERLVDAGAPRRRSSERPEDRALETLADVPSQRSGSETSVQRPTTATSDSQEVDTVADLSASFDKTLSERPEARNKKG